MGEYADMEIDRDFSNYLDFKLGNSFNDSYIDEWEGEDIPLIYVEKFHSFEFLEVKFQTEKAWLLVMSGKAERWFSKKYCRIKGNKVMLPTWLMNKMAGW